MCVGVGNIISIKKFTKKVYKNSSCGKLIT
nr:MAG TPA: hypothetical protein [Caudoviricetes sp.]